MEADIGDFIIRRADELFAYHLATVVDDALDGYTEIVRGKDQYSLTPQHVYLQQLLGMQTPQYAHLPLLINQQGEKLAKSTRAQAVDSMHRHDVWSSVLGALGMQAEPGLLDEDNVTIMQWASGEWDLLSINPADKIIP
jgi:glutamyl-Q tRNA(Asp) synthetase